MKPASLAQINENTFLLCKPDIEHMHREVMQIISQAGFLVQAKSFRMLPEMAEEIAKRFPSVRHRVATRGSTTAEGNAATTTSKALGIADKPVGGSHPPSPAAYEQHSGRQTGRTANVGSLTQHTGREKKNNNNNDHQAVSPSPPAAQSSLLMTLYKGGGYEEEDYHRHRHGLTEFSCHTHTVERQRSTTNGSGGGAPGPSSCQLPYIPSQPLLSFGSGAQARRRVPPQPNESDSEDHRHHQVMVEIKRLITRRKEMDTGVNAGLPSSSSSTSLCADGSSAHSGGGGPHEPHRPKEPESGSSTSESSTTRHSVAPPSRAKTRKMRRTSDSSPAPHSGPAKTLDHRREQSEDAEPTSPGEGAGTLQQRERWDSATALNNRIFESMSSEEYLHAHVNHLAHGGTCLAVLLSAPNAVDRLKELVGPENPVDARRVKPSSLRARLGTDLIRNAVYAAVTLSDANSLIAVVFGYSPQYRSAGDGGTNTNWEEGPDGGEGHASASSLSSFGRKVRPNMGALHLLAAGSATTPGAILNPSVSANHIPDRGVPDEVSGEPAVPLHPGGMGTPGSLTLTLHATDKWSPGGRGPLSTGESLTHGPPNDSSNHTPRSPQSLPPLNPHLSSGTTNCTNDMNPITAVATAQLSHLNHNGNSSGAWSGSVPTSAAALPSGPAGVAGGGKASTMMVDKVVDERIRRVQRQLDEDRESLQLKTGVLRVRELDLLLKEQFLRRATREWTEAPLPVSPFTAAAIAAAKQRTGRANELPYEEMDPTAPQWTPRPPQRVTDTMPRLSLGSVAGMMGGGDPMNSPTQFTQIHRRFSSLMGGTGVDGPVYGSGAWMADLSARYAIEANSMMNPTAGGLASMFHRFSTVGLSGAAAGMMDMYNNSTMSTAVANARRSVGFNSTVITAQAGHFSPSNASPNVNSPRNLHGTQSPSGTSRTGHASPMHRRPFQFTPNPSVSSEDISELVKDVMRRHALFCALDVHERGWLSREDLLALVLRSPGLYLHIDAEQQARMLRTLERAMDKYSTVNPNSTAISEAAAASGGPRLPALSQQSTSDSLGALSSTPALHRLSMAIGAADESTGGDGLPPTSSAATNSSAQETGSKLPKKDRRGVAMLDFDAFSEILLYLLRQ